MALRRHISRPVVAAVSAFASYLAFHFSVKSLGGARDIALVRATFARVPDYVFGTLAHLYSIYCSALRTFLSLSPCFFRLLVLLVSPARWEIGYLVRVTLILEWMDRWLLWYCDIWGSGGSSHGSVHFDCSSACGE